MATGSGLDAQFGFGPETTWSTAVTPTKFIEFNSENLVFTPTWLEPTGLRVGTKYKRGARVRQARKTASGDIQFELATRGLGVLFKHMTGSALSAPTIIGATTAYQTNFVPGDYRGLGLTLQVGRPEPSTGTVRPFTYKGMKVISWELTVKDGAVPELKLMFDGRQEDTAIALTAASYATGASVFDFSQATLKLGGTASTTTGYTTIAGGVAVATVVREFHLKSDAPMDVQRFGLGNAGLKSEPLENATPVVTGSLVAEFNKAELYDPFQANTTQSLQFTLTGALIGASANNDTFDITVPAMKLKKASPNVAGPAVVQMSSDFECYSDEVNPVYQVMTKSADSTF